MNGVHWHNWCITSFFLCTKRETIKQNPDASTLNRWHQGSRHVAHSYTCFSDEDELSVDPIFGFFWAGCSIPQTHSNWEQNLTVLKAPTVVVTHGMRGERTHQGEDEQRTHLSSLGLLCEMKSQSEAGSKFLTQSRDFCRTYMKQRQGNTSVFYWCFR